MGNVSNGATKEGDAQQDKSRKKRGVVRGLKAFNDLKNGRISMTLGKEDDDDTPGKKDEDDKLNKKGNDAPQARVTVSNPGKLPKGKAKSGNRRDATTKPVALYSVKKPAMVEIGVLDDDCHDMNRDATADETMLGTTSKTRQVVRHPDTVSGLGTGRVSITLNKQTEENMLVGFKENSRGSRSAENGIRALKPLHSNSFMKKPKMVDMGVLDELDVREGRNIDPGRDTDVSENGVAQAKGNKTDVGTFNIAAGATNSGKAGERQWDSF